MNFIKIVMPLFLLLSLNKIRAMDVHEFIEEHKNEPDILRDVLIDMGRWQTPDLNVARKLLSLGVSPNAKDKGNIALDNPGATALTTAAGSGKTEYVKFLLDAGADIEIKDPWDGRTALMDAALYGHIDTLKLLLARGANPNATNCYNRTALIWAADKAYAPVVKLLIEAKADVNIKDVENYRYDKDGKRIGAIEGQTALSYAKKAGHNDIVKLLEDAGAKE